MSKLNFAPNALEGLGIEVKQPSFINKYVMRWNNFEGIEEISISETNGKCSFASVKLSKFEDISIWDVSKSTSIIDDSETVTISLLSKCKRAKLIIRRQKGKLEAYINVDEHVATGSEVTTRIDKHEAVTMVWDVSNNHTAVFHPQSSTLVNALKNSASLMARIAPYLKNNRLMSFKLKGLKMYLIN